VSRFKKVRYKIYRTAATSRTRISARPRVPPGHGAPFTRYWPRYRDARAAQLAVIRLDVAARASPVRYRIFCKQARAKGQLISPALSCLPPRAPLPTPRCRRSRVADGGMDGRKIPRDFEQIALSNGSKFSFLLLSFSPGFLYRKNPRSFPSRDEIAREIRAELSSPEIIAR